MASGVNVKMGVSGVAQFKQNMNQAKQAVKTLDAQLALSEKQFKQTGDSQGYMAEKGALLEAKLENQKKILAEAQRALEDMASKGIDKSSKAYQDMYRAMIEAKGAIIDTENAMAGITDEGDKAASGVSEMNAQLKNISKGVNYQNVTEGIGKITSAMEGAIKKAVDLGKAIVSEVLGAGSWADDIGTRAKYYGVTEEELQRMEKTARLIDTPVEAIINAKKKLKKELAGEGQKDMGAYAALGINPNDAKDADDLFWRVGEAIMKETDEIKQEAYAQELLGRSWNELIPLFETGKKEYDELNKSWSVVPEEQLKALQEMDDQYQSLKNEFETLKMTVAGAFADPLKEAMRILTSLMERFNEYLASPDGQKAMEKLGEAVTSLIESLVDINPDDVVNGIGTALDKITGAFEWIETNKDNVKKALEVIAGGFLLLKTGEVALVLGQFVSSAKELVHKGGQEAVSETAEALSEATSATTEAAETAAEAAGNAKEVVKSGKLSPKNQLRQKALEVSARSSTSALTNDAFLADWFFNYTDLGRWTDNKISEMLGGKGSKLLIHGEQYGPWGDLNGWAESVEKAREMAESGEAPEFFNWLLGNGKQLHQQWLDKQEENAYWQQTHGKGTEPEIPKSGDLTQAEYDALVFAGGLKRAAYEAEHGTIDEQKQREWLRGNTSWSTGGPEVEQKVEEAATRTEYSIDQMRELAEELARSTTDDVESSSKDISNAADKMLKLPGDTAAAVRQALNDVKIYIDGYEITGAIGKNMADVLLRYGP